MFQITLHFVIPYGLPMVQFQCIEVVKKEGHGQGGI